MWSALAEMLKNAAGQIHDLVTTIADSDDGVKPERGRARVHRRVLPKRAPVVTRRREIRSAPIAPC